VIIDWSWTYPTWWRTIKKHEWHVYGWEWYDYKYWLDWNPWGITVSFPWNWQYTIALTIVDNENNQITRSYGIIVSDPVSSLKLSPKEWTTSTTFSFDASLSYSIESKIKTYSWTIFDPNWNQIDNFEWKEFKRRFTTPW